MNDALIYALVPTIATGGVVLAYRHPRHYAAIFPWLLALTLAGYIILLAWGIGVSEVFSRLVPFLESGQFDEARAAIDSMRVGWGTTALWCFSIAVYVMVLRSLEHLHDHKDRGPEPPDQK